MIMVDPAASIATIALSGEIDIATRHAVTDQVRLALAQQPREITLDLSKVSFLDSTGLGAIIAARASAEAQGVPLSIAAMSPQVRRLLELTGTATMLSRARTA